MNIHNPDIIFWLQNEDRLLKLGIPLFTFTNFSNQPFLPHQLFFGVKTGGLQQMNLTVTTNFVDIKDKRKDISGTHTG